MAAMRRLLLVALLAAAAAAAVDQNRLAALVDEILRRFRVQRMPMFSLAVSVPPGAEPGSYDLNQVQDDNVRDTILRCQVYAGHNVVAATILRWPDVARDCPGAQVPWRDVLDACGRQSMTWGEVAAACPDKVADTRTDHAEYRVLERFHSWAQDKDKSGLLVFYAHAAPCEARCSSTRNHLSILQLLRRVGDWQEHVLVFSKLLVVKTLWEGNTMPDSRLIRALRNLGGALGDGGLAKIFRCDRPRERNAAMTCTSCSAGGQVTPKCYKEDGEEGGVQGGGGAPGGEQTGGWLEV
ncbi:uncharacterized protein LOC144020288 [Festucalex cinctus]